MAVLLTVVISSNVFASDLLKGTADFMTFCASCHGVNGRGNGPMVRELTKQPADLTKLTKQPAEIFPRGDIKKIVDGRTMPRSHGTAQMPVWGQRFSFQATADGTLQEDQKGIEKQVDDRLENIMTYLESIQR